MNDLKIVKMTINGQEGTATIKWIPNDGYNMPHYAAFLTVPFQKSRWEHLFISDKKEIEKAIEAAKIYLEIALERCTLC